MSQLHEKLNNNQIINTVLGAAALSGASIEDLPTDNGASEGLSDQDRMLAWLDKAEAAQGLGDANTYVVKERESKGKSPVLICPEELKYADETEIYKVLFSEIEKRGIDPEGMLYTGHTNISGIYPKTTFAFTKPELDTVVQDGSELSPIGYALERINVDGGKPMITIYDGNKLVKDDHIDFSYNPLPGQNISSAEVIRFELPK